MTASTPLPQLPSMTQASTEGKGRGHVPQLDSLRGVAALVVVFNHFHLAWLDAGAPAWLTRFRIDPVLWLLVDGHASVMLFFLLSGFVLMLPYLQGRRQGYARFAARRILRIYPTFLAALAFAVAACALFSGKPSIGHIIGHNWPSMPDLDSVVRHATLLLPIDIFRYDNPVWSLVHEARISLVFPLLALLALRLSLSSTLSVAVLCSLVTPYALHFEGGLPAALHMTAWSYSLRYCGIFLVGAALARRRHAAVAMVERLPRAGRAALFCAALALYLYPLPGWRLLERGDLCCALAAGVLLTFALRNGGTVTRLLRFRPVLFLGRISYSLYLVHLPVLMILCAVLPHRLPFPALLPLYLASAVLVATLLHHIVELPSIAWSKRLGALRLSSWPWRSAPLSSAG